MITTILFKKLHIPYKTHNIYIDKWDINQRDLLLDVLLRIKMD